MPMMASSAGLELNFYGDSGLNIVGVSQPYKFISCRVYAKAVFDLSGSAITYQDKSLGQSGQIQSQFMKEVNAKG